MIPPLDEHGYLPPGVHPATLDEVEARFGRESELSLANQADFDLLVEEFFATDRHSVPKGMVEVVP